MSRIRVLCVALLMLAAVRYLAVFAQEKTVAELAVFAQEKTVAELAVFAQEKTVAELAAELPELSTFNLLVAQAGIALTGDVYAPTDAAFARWPQFVTEYVAADPALLTSILEHHIVTESSTLTFKTTEEGILMTVDNANVMEPLNASDGTLTLIDTVLLPEIVLPEVIPADVTGDITMAGSSTVFPISQTIAANFAYEGFSGQITADSIGTGAGFERFCAAEGASDIANASRAIKPSEVEACAAHNQRVPVGFHVGDDGLAVVVNPANDWVTDLSSEQLAQAFSTATTWADIDPTFPNCDIQRWSPGTDSGTFDFFVETVLDDDSAPLLAAGNLNLSEDDNILLDGVANNECAIGYFGFAYYIENAERVNLLAVDGVAPGAAAINEGLYRLTRPLYVYVAPDLVAAKPQIGEFLTYYLRRVPEVTPAANYFLPDPFDFNQSKLTLLALLNIASDR